MRQAVSSALKERTRFYFLYTLLFGLFSIALFSPFLVTGKSLIWQTDGLAQHFNAFVYLGTWMREILKNLIFEHQFMIPMWEFSIGYGADVLTTLQYYVLGDPVALFSVVTPSAYAEEMYCLLILFRLYLAGIAFCAFCRKMECGRAASLCGAFAYAFCSFSIYAAVRHPYFASPMIYLPLILLGAEKILRKEKPIFYVAMIFVAAISNFYFFYMLVLLTVLYVAFRFFSLYKEQVWKNLGINLIKFIGFSVVGVLMACILFFPMVMAFLSDTRADSQYALDLFYPASYYEAFLKGFVTSYAPGYWSLYGITPIALLGAVGVYLRRKENGWIKALFIVLTLFLLLPVAGYIFNGFGYVANRWVFGYSFLVAFMFTKSMPDLMELTVRKKVVLTIGSVVFCGLCLFLEKSRYEATLAGCVILMISVSFLLLLPSIPTISWKKLCIPSRRVIQAGFLFLVLFGILFNGLYRYADTEGNYVVEFMDEDFAFPELEEQRAKAVGLIEDEDFYRIDQTSTGATFERNYLLSSGIRSTAGYWSIQNPAVFEYLFLNSDYSNQGYGYRGMQSRSLLTPFASASFFICDEGQEKLVPYGYEYVDSVKTYLDNTVHLYHSDYTLPLGYTCAEWLSREEYNEMTVEQRQQAMLQGAVIETGDEESVAFIKKAEPVYRESSLVFTMEADENVEIGENSFTVKKAKSTVTLSMECPEDVELYVHLTGVSYESRHAYSFLTPEEWEEYSKYQKYQMERSLRNWIPQSETTISAYSHGVSTYAKYYTNKNSMSSGRTDYLLNLNYSDKKRTTIKLTFDQPGIYTFDKLSVVSQPVDFLKEQTDAMKEDVLEEVEILPNTITGKISLDEEKLLCLSVPYSKGWTAFVDGKEQELLKTNVMYMGLPLSAGEHTIELRYTTPYLKEGILLSGIGFIAFLTIIVVYAVRKKKSA